MLLYLLESLQIFRFLNVRSMFLTRLLKAFPLHEVNRYVLISLSLTSQQRNRPIRQILW